MSPVSVLLVDDEPFLRQRLRDVLEDEGLEVVGQAGDGEEAVAQAAALRPDVVLLDLRMPGVGGLEALPRVREAVPQARVVVVSAYDDSGLQDQALAAGADAYFVKGRPVDRLVSLVTGARA